MFTVDGKIYHFGKLIIDLLWMNLIWVFYTLIGIGLTIGASTYALSYIMNERLDGCACTRRRFRERFLVGLKHYNYRIVCLYLISVITIYNLLHIEQMGVFFDQTVLWIIVLLQLVVLFVFIAFFPYYLFCLTSKDQKINDNPLIIAINMYLRNPFLTFTITVLGIACSIGLLTSPVLVFCVFSGYSLIVHWLIREGEKVNEKV